METRLNATIFINSTVGYFSTSGFEKLNVFVYLSKLSKDKIAT
jgi:hypothetical protein